MFLFESATDFPLPESLSHRRSGEWRPKVHNSGDTFSVRVLTTASSGPSCTRRLSSQREVSDGSWMPTDTHAHRLTDNLRHAATHLSQGRSRWRSVCAVRSQSDRPAPPVGPGPRRAEGETWPVSPRARHAPQVFKPAPVGERSAEVVQTRT